jgi:hypothetical protein
MQQLCMNNRNCAISCRLGRLLRSPSYACATRVKCELLVVAPPPPAHMPRSSSRQQLRNEMGDDGSRETFSTWRAVSSRRASYRGHVRRPAGRPSPVDRRTPSSTIDESKSLHVSPGPAAMASPPGIAAGSQAARFLHCHWQAEQHNYTSSCTHVFRNQRPAAAVTWSTQPIDAISLLEHATVASDF